MTTEKEVRDILTDEWDYFVRLAMRKVGDRGAEVVNTLIAQLFGPTKTGLPLWTTFDSKKSASLKTWITGILLRRIIDDYRHSAVENAYIDEESAADAVGSDPYPVQELQVDVQKALACLSNTDRNLAILFYLEGWTLEEVAKHFEIPKSTLYRKLLRIEDRLRAHLSEYAPEKSVVVLSGRIEDFTGLSKRPAA